MSPETERARWALANLLSDPSCQLRPPRKADLFTTLGSENHKRTDVTAALADLAGRGLVTVEICLDPPELSIVDRGAAVGVWMFPDPLPRPIKFEVVRPSAELRDWLAINWDMAQFRDAAGDRANSQDRPAGPIAPPDVPAMPPVAASGTPAARGAGSDTGRAGASPSLPPARLKAYGQYRDAVRRNNALDGATDREVYAWLAENLDAEELPSFATWARYLREARQAEGTSKHTSRAGRSGRSIVNPDQI